MDTQAQHAKRDLPPEPDDGEGGGSRFARFLGSGGGSRPGPWHKAGLLLFGCLVLVLLVSVFAVQPFLIPSGSMEPTLKDGDRVLVNKVAYRFGFEPQRGDVVVFDGAGSFVPEGSEGIDYVKRVVGVGDDRVVCCDKDGRIAVNGEPLEEWYLQPGDAPSRVPFDIVVPEGKLFVLGDHRGSSRDSRDHLGQPGGGMVPVDRVVGRADWIAWPTDRWTTLERPAAYARVPGPVGAHG